MKNHNLPTTKLFLGLLIFMVSFLLAPNASANDSSPLLCDDDFGVCDFQRYKGDTIYYYISFSHFEENGGVEKVGEGSYPGQRERDALVAAFDLWGEVIDVEFVETTDEFDPNIDITLGWDSLPDGVLGSAFAVWDPSYEPQFTDIYFNIDLEWTDQFSYNFDARVDLVTVAAHEIGHALGLVHTPDPDSLMFWATNFSHRYLSNEDVARITTLYTGSGECVIPDSGPWPPCATGEDGGSGEGGGTGDNGECVIPDSGPWPPCATGEDGGSGDGGNTGDNGECVIPDSGPWPPCATGEGGNGSGDTGDSGECVIPDSGPWPPCATGQNSVNVVINETIDLAPHTPIYYP